MRLLVVSLRTTGVMKETFEDYCKMWSSMVELYCITNDNVADEALGAKETLHLHYRRQEPWSYLSPAKIKRAKCFMDRLKPDMVLFFTPHPDNIFLIKAAAKYRVTAQIHNPIPHSGTAITERLISALQKKLYFKYCSAIFVAGQSLKNDLIRCYNIAPEKIYSIKFAMLTSHMVNQPNTKSRAEDTDVIFFGRIEPYKGLDVLIKATKFTKHRLKMIIAGKGKPYFDVSMAQADVQFYNEYIAADKLVEMIKSSKIVVMPYRDATGSITVIEAYNLGKPVVASDVGVFSEYVGDAGITVPPENPQKLAEAIDYLLDHPEVRSQMSITARSYMDTEYELKKNCAVYVNVLQSLNGVVPK